MLSLNQILLVACFIANYLNGNSSNGKIELKRSKMASIRKVSLELISQQYGDRMSAPFNDSYNFMSSAMNHLVKNGKLKKSIYSPCSKADRQVSKLNHYLITSIGIKFLQSTVDTKSVIKEYKKSKANGNYKVDIKVKKSKLSAAEVAKKIVVNASKKILPIKASAKNTTHLMVKLNKLYTVPENYIELIESFLKNYGSAKSGSIAFNIINAYPKRFTITQKQFKSVVNSVAGSGTKWQCISKNKATNEVEFV